MSFLKSILNRYGLGNKPLINTETALYCDVNTDPCFETQAVFTAKAYAEGIALGLQGLVYYALKSEWRLTGLLRPDNTPRPSYLAFKTAADFLTLAQYRGPVTGYPGGIFGRSFSLYRGRSIDVIWSTDGAPQSVALPFGATAFDRYGNPLPLSGNKITVDYGPVYVRIPYNLFLPVIQKPYKLFLPIIQKPLQGTPVKLEPITTSDLNVLRQKMVGNQVDFASALWEPYITPRGLGMTGSIF